MCLYKDKKHHPFNRPLVAEKDIVCYKQLYLNCANMLVTSCRHILVPIKCIQKNKRKRVPFKAEIVEKFRFFCCHVLGTSGIVNDGFIHVYTYPRQNWGNITFKCIIPKGTKYFIGLKHDLAAKEIIFLERVNYN